MTGVGWVMMTWWGASRNVGTSGGVNTGGADPGGSSSPCNIEWQGQVSIPFHMQD
jgi:hypothetical protein